MARPTARPSRQALRSASGSGSDGRFDLAAFNYQNSPQPNPTSDASDVPTVTVQEGENYTKLSKRVYGTTRYFSALGHSGRLLVFRLLMRHAPHGVRPTEIAESLGLKQNTLSHYLAELEAAGLIHSERQGRSIRYAASIGAASSLIAYLFTDCGRSRPELSTSLFPMPEPIMSNLLVSKAGMMPS